MQNYRIRWKTHNKGYYAVHGQFKVIEVGTNRKPVSDFLLVINTDILSRTVSELS